MSNDFYDDKDIQNFLCPKVIAVPKMKGESNIQHIKRFKKANNIKTECEWEFQTYTYKTSCENVFRFTECSSYPKEYNFKYCPYCADKIKLIEETKE